MHEAWAALAGLAVLFGAKCLEREEPSALWSREHGVAPDRVVCSGRRLQPGLEMPNLVLGVPCRPDGIYFDTILIVHDFSLILRW